MGRKLRHIPEPWTLQEITVRCIQGRYLLRPSPRLTAIFIGALAHALTKCAVKLHAFHALSSHFGLIISPRSASAMADFMKLVDHKLSIELTHLHDWPGKTWDRRYANIPILDDEAQLARLKYQFSNSVKENLVASPLAWPGPHCARHLLDGTPLEGIWINRTAMNAAQRENPDDDISEDDFTTRLTLELTPLPCLAHKSVGARRATYRRLIKEVEEEGRQARAESGASLLGARRVQEIHPHTRPEQLDRSPAPPCHASTKERVKEWVGAYRNFADAYHRAVERLRAGLKQFEFPDGGIPPCTPQINVDLAVPP